MSDTAPVTGVACVPYALPLARPWVAASTTLDVRRGMLLRLVDADGIVGWGDCAPLPSSGEEAHARAFDELKRAASGLRGRTPTRLLTDSIRSSSPEVCWAIESALHDLLAQRQGVSLAELLVESDDPPAAGEVQVNAALGTLDDRCPARASQALTDGFLHAKIKVGVDDPGRELERLQELNRVVDGRLRLRLDANRAWPLADARRFLAVIGSLPIDAVEEPLADPTLDGLAELQAGVDFPLAIDESLPRFGAASLLASGAVRRLVIKPARIGGIQATCALARAARQAGLELVITSVVDSAIGVTAAAQLAAALAPQQAHGLATGSWLARDVAPGLVIQSGSWRRPQTPGLGVAPFK